MNIIPSMLSLLACVIVVSGDEPLHQWNFEASVPPAGNDELQGPWSQVAGVAGQAVVFDGYRTELV
ncbi:MAG: hypothetical protein WCS43_11135, partial [Verrucomicrobiota bacterium]